MSLVIQAFVFAVLSIAGLVWFRWTNPFDATVGSATAVLVAAIWACVTLVKRRSERAAVGTDDCIEANPFGNAFWGAFAAAVAIGTMAITVSIARQTSLVSLFESERRAAFRSTVEVARERGNLTKIADEAEILLTSSGSPLSDEFRSEIRAAASASLIEAAKKSSTAQEAAPLLERAIAINPSDALAREFRQQAHQQVDVMVACDALTAAKRWDTLVEKLRGAVAQPPSGPWAVNWAQRLVDVLVAKSKTEEDVALQEVSLREAIRFTELYPHADATLAKSALDTIIEKKERVGAQVAARTALAEASAQAARDRSEIADRERAIQALRTEAESNRHAETAYLRELESAARWADLAAALRAAMFRTPSDESNLAPRLISALEAVARDQSLPNESRVGAADEAISVAQKFVPTKVDALKSTRLALLPVVIPSGTTAVVTRVDRSALPATLAFDLFIGNDRNGTDTLLSGLSSKDVRVQIDAGSPARPLAVSDVHPIDEPLSVVVLVDRSGSMRGDALEQAKRATVRLCASLPATAQIEVMSFSDQCVSIFTGRAGRSLEIEIALKPLAASGGTRLWGAAHDGLASLVKQKGRTFLVLFSDGGDDHGVEGRGAVMQRALAQGTTIHSVGLRGAELDAKGLSVVAVATGGVYAEAESAQLIPEQFAKIVREIRRPFYRIVVAATPTTVPTRMSIAIGRDPVLEAAWTSNQVPAATSVTGPSRP